MPINEVATYEDSLDNFPTVNGGDTLNAAEHSKLHNLTFSAIKSLEEIVGIASQYTAATWSGSVLSKLSSLYTSLTALDTKVGNTGDAASATSVYGAINAVKGVLGTSSDTPTIDTRINSVVSSVGTSTDPSTYNTVYGKMAAMESRLTSTGTSVASVQSQSNMLVNGDFRVSQRGAIGDFTHNGLRATFPLYTTRGNWAFWFDGWEAQTSSVDYFSASGSWWQAVPVTGQAPKIRQVIDLTDANVSYTQAFTVQLKASNWAQITSVSLVLSKTSGTKTYTRNVAKAAATDVLWDSGAKTFLFDVPPTTVSTYDDGSALGNLAAAGFTHMFVVINGVTNTNLSVTYARLIQGNGQSHHYAEELPVAKERCQRRYYNLMADRTTDSGVHSFDVMKSQRNTIRWPIKFPTYMRNYPSFRTYSTFDPDTVPTSTSHTWASNNDLAHEEAVDTPHNPVQLNYGMNPIAQVWSSYQDAVLYSQGSESNGEPLTAGWGLVLLLVSDNCIFEWEAEPW